MSIDKKKAWEDAQVVVARDYPDIEDKSDKWHQIVMQEYKKAIGSVTEQRTLRETLLLKESPEFSILRHIYEAKNGRI